MAEQPRSQTPAAPGLGNTGQGASVLTRVNMLALARMKQRKKKKNLRGEPTDVGPLSRVTARSVPGRGPGTPNMGDWTNPNNPGPWRNPRTGKRAW